VLRLAITNVLPNTPWQERSINFSSDGKSLVYAGGKNNNWNIYKISIVRKEEPYFYASTLLKQDTVCSNCCGKNFNLHFLLMEKKLLTSKTVLR
jgi:hypothetical protein